MIDGIGHSYRLFSYDIWHQNTSLEVSLKFCMSPQDGYPPLQQMINPPSKKWAKLCDFGLINHHHISFWVEISESEGKLINKCALIQVHFVKFTPF